jgi:hypothetical protein
VKTLDILIIFGLLIFGMILKWWEGLYDNPSDIVFRYKRKIANDDDFYLFDNENTIGFSTGRHLLHYITFNSTPIYINGYYEHWVSRDIKEYVYKQLVKPLNQVDIEERQMNKTKLEEIRRKIK